MAPTPKRKHSTRRKGIRRSARLEELKKQLKNLNPLKNTHLRTLSSQNSK